MSFKTALAIAVGFGFGLWYSWVALRRSRDMARAQRWPSTSGTIVESAIHVVDKKKHFRVRYEFTAIEKMEGATPRISGDWFFSGRAQREFVARWVPGQAVEVFFDPADPRKSCIDRTDRSGITALWVLALSMIALASFLTWFVNDEIWRALG
jgi:hypothetical protein